MGRVRDRKNREWGNQTKWYTCCCGKEIRGPAFWRHENACKIKQVVDAIIELAQYGRAVGPISNEKIYQHVTKRERFSKKAWEPLKPVLSAIARKRFYCGFQLNYYSPMLASRYNIKLSDTPFIYVAGFSVTKCKR